MPTTFTPKLGKKLSTPVGAGGAGAQPAGGERIAPRTAQTPPAEQAPQEGGVLSVLRDLGIGLGQSAGSAVYGAGQLGEKILQGTAGRVVKAVTGKEAPRVYGDVQPEVLQPKNTAQKIGKGVGDIAQFFIPSGAVSKTVKAADVAATKLPKFLQGIAKTGARMGTEAISAGGVRAIQTGGDLGEAGGVAAFAGAIPGVAKIAQIAGKATPRVAQILTGVPKETIQRAASPKYYKQIGEAMKVIGENEKQPYFRLTQKVGAKVKASMGKASEGVKGAIGKFVKDNPDVKFDLAAKADDVTKALEPFRTAGLIVPRKGRGFKISTTPQSPFSNRETDALNKLLEKIQQSKSIGPEDVLALKRSFASAYDDIPLGVNGTPRPYHAAVMALKQKADDVIEGILPEPLKGAMKEYRNFETFMDDVGHRIIDGSGKLKQNAEQFVSNLGNLNKGEVRRLFQSYARIVGTNLPDDVQVIKDAQKLSPLFAATGSRTQDVLRAFLAAGLGFGAGGTPIGSVVGLAATSPRIVGKAARVVGAAKSKLGGVTESPILQAVKRRLVGR